MTDTIENTASSSAASDSPRSNREDGAAHQGSPDNAPCRESLDLDLGCAKGTGPRLFCGHVPKEVNDEMVRAHFSQWGAVADVYFPRHKKTLKRRPFCFVTFGCKQDAERALAESGLEIGGVAIKNLTMVEDRDKYYTNKHASARQSLLHALKQLGPTGGAPANGTAPANGSLPPAGPPTRAAYGSGPTAGMSAEQLSNLAAVLALEGVPTDVVLQTLGLPATLAEALLPAVAAPALGALDSASAALLAQALGKQAPLSAQPSYDLTRASVDLRTSFDLSSASVGGMALGSSRNSLDLSSLHASILASGLPGMDGSSMSRMRGADSRSTLASTDWSSPASARTSMDLGALAGLPAATAGFLASAAASSSSLQRLSLDAALQQQALQQQQAALLGAQTRMSAAGGYAGQSHNLASVMHSGFYQAAAPPPPPPPTCAEQLSIQSVLSSGLYGGGGGGGGGGTPPLPPARHSIALGDTYGSGGGLVPFGDTWTPAPPQPAAQHQTLAGYSTVLRPSIDRSGLPPLPPRSPNQDPVVPRQSMSGSPDSLLGSMSGGMGMPGGRWPMPSQRVMA